MTKSNNKWVPGDVCLAERSTAEWVKVELLKYNDEMGRWACVRTVHPYDLFYSFNVEAIKTEAENRREMSIGDLASDIGSMGMQYFNDPWAAATKLHDAGYIKPKPLTESVICQIHSNLRDSQFRTFACRIGAYIRGELDL